MGHELKTPLAIILALSGRLLNSSGLEPADRADVAAIRTNAYVTLRRLQDLLLLSHLESGELALEPSVVDVAELVRRCAQGFSGLTSERGQRLDIVVPPTLAGLVDEERLVSLVSNLLANAVRHTPPSGVVRCSLRRAGAQLELEVADSGPGVPPEERDNVFKPLRRGRTAGQGLGLAIVKQIAGLHSGTVTVDRAPEGGALFRVVLPGAGSGEPPSDLPKAAPLVSDQRIMIEDLRAELD